MSLVLIGESNNFTFFTRYLEILFKFFLYHFFLLTSMLSLWRNNFIFEKSMYFPVIPDTSHGLLRS